MPSLNETLEHFKSPYLLVLRFLFFLVRSFTYQLDRHVLFITSFSNNNALLRQEFSNAGYSVHEVKPSFINILSQFYFISRAKIIIVDNYYYPFAMLPLNNKKIVQVWHANGAIKKFGLASPKNLALSPSSLKRFKAVYSNVSFIPVGSDKMQSFLKRAFDFVDDDKFLKIGLPRSDAFFKSNYTLLASNTKARYSMLEGKIVILYLPTFRDSGHENEKQISFLKKLSLCLPKNFVVCYHFHQEFYKQGNNPNFKNTVNILSDDLIYFYDFSDLIITDYSSVIFEACLRNKPLAFYLYDYDQYQYTQGLFLSQAELPGFCCNDSDTMFNYITSGNYDNTKTNTFSCEWNQYNKGSSCKALVRALSK